MFYWNVIFISAHNTDFFKYSFCIILDINLRMLIFPCLHLDYLKLHFKNTNNTNKTVLSVIFGKSLFHSVHL